MSMRSKLAISVALAAFVFAAWRYLLPSAEAPLGNAPRPASEMSSTALSPVAKSATTTAPPDSVPAGHEAAESSLAESQNTEPGPDPKPLNERALVGTKCERDGFSIEFGADGKLLIGGRERAKWRVEGPRVRLYRDTTGEEHWLDIVGNKLMWEGQEVGRTR